MDTWLRFKAKNFVFRDMKIYENNGLKKGLNPIFKQWTKQDYAIQNKNTRCVRQMWKRIFNMLKHENMNMKRIRQGYGVRSCLILMLNILKEIKNPIFIYTLLGI
jgi:hypothetical protein